MIKKVLKCLLIAAALLLALWALSWLFNFSQNQTVFGVSFNADYARYLGLDPKKVLETMLSEWKFKYVRLSAQWNNLEPTRGRYDFSDLDWQMELAEKYGAKVMLAVGQKIPRWPECHAPQWAKTASAAEYETALMDFIRATVARYRTQAALEIWQVENEPFLTFGICRQFTREQLEQEMALVKEMDLQHPTITTDSGELSFWRKTGQAADLFGTTMYRVVWNKYSGYLNYDWVPPLFYRAKLWLIGRDRATAFITELQAEPWMNGGEAMSVPLSEQYQSMSFERFKKNIAFAQAVGLPRAYLWGGEWWYWLRTQGAGNDFIEQVKLLTKE